MRFSSEAQRRAVMSKLQRGATGSAGTPHRPTWFVRHPVLSSLGASLLLGGLGVPVMRKAIASFQRVLPASGLELSRLAVSARRLYPQVARLAPSHGGGGIVSSGLVAHPGPGFVSPSLVKAAGRWSLNRRLQRRLYPTGEAEMRRVFAKPMLLLPQFRTPVAAAAHEFGHAAFHLGRFPRVKGHLVGASKVLTREGLPIVGSLSAQPVIARSHLSDKTKRRLHLATGLAPLAISMPMMGDEALASVRGLKILKHAGLYRPGMRRLLLSAFSTYGAAALPGAIAGLTAGTLYRRRYRPPSLEKGK